LLVRSAAKFDLAPFFVIMSVNETIDIGESLLAGSDDHVQVEAREHANNEPSLPHEAETLSLMESEEVVDPESDTAPVEVDAAVASDGGEEVEEEVAAAADQVAEPDARERSDKLHQLPLSRVKAIMKLDPEFQMASKEAAILIAKAAVRKGSSCCLSSTTAQ
jgi:hypothetical protein